MSRLRLGLVLAVCVGFWGSGELHGQALPTATRTLGLSVFALGSGVYTGFESGRNIGLTAGLAAEFRPRFGLQPAVEVRGTYPLDKGQVASERNVLGGLDVALPLRGLRVYGDILFGRGQINYAGGAANPARTLAYVQSTSFVVAAGGGVKVRLSDHFFVRADAQLERYGSPVTASGHLLAVPVSVGGGYRF